MLFCSCSARCNHRNRKVIRHFSKCFIGVSGLYAIMIHAGEKYFSGTTFLGFFCPGKQLLICFYTASIQITPPAFSVCLASTASTHTCEPKFLAISSISSGRRIAEELIEILSAPAFSRRSTSLNSLIPPPTVNGILILAAMRFTNSANVLRPSKLAVISRKPIHQHLAHYTHAPVPPDRPLDAN